MAFRFLKLLKLSKTVKCSPVLNAMFGWQDVSLEVLLAFQVTDFFFCSHWIVTTSELVFLRSWTVSARLLLQRCRGPFFGLERDKREYSRIRNICTSYLYIKLDKCIIYIHIYTYIYTCHWPESVWPIFSWCKRQGRRCGPFVFDLSSTCGCEDGRFSSQSHLNCPNFPKWAAV